MCGCWRTRWSCNRMSTSFLHWSLGQDFKTTGWPECLACPPNSLAKVPLATTASTSTRYMDPPDLGEAECSPWGAFLSSTLSSWAYLLATRNWMIQWDEGGAPKMIWLEIFPPRPGGSRPEARSQKLCTFTVYLIHYMICLLIYNQFYAWYIFMLHSYSSLGSLFLYIFSDLVYLFISLIEILLLYY